jgi:hypothetical protein
MKSLILGLVVLFGAVALLHAEVSVEEVPEQGLQPDVAVASDGTVHLVYLRGDPKAADIRYTLREPGGACQADILKSWHQRSKALAKSCEPKK